MNNVRYVEKSLKDNTLKPHPLAAAVENIWRYEDATVSITSEFMSC